MNVKKIFKVLITIVACVLIGAFALNVMLPNVTKTVINSTEDMIYKSTGLAFDFNNDGISGSSNKQYQGDQGDTDGVGVDTVEGFN